MAFDHSDSAVALVGMDGFRLLAAAMVDGELHQLVETTVAVVGCPACGTRALSKGPAGGARARPPRRGTAGGGGVA